MRVWFIPTSYLDNKRLNSQHYESHAIATILLEGKNWGSMQRLFANSVDYVKAVHDKCVEEMLRRGKAHATPYKEIPSEFRSKQFVPTFNQLQTDVGHLRSKWEREGYYFGTGREDLRQLEEMYGLPIGRDPENAWEIKVITRFVIKQNHVLYRSMEGRVQDRLAAMLERRPELANSWEGHDYICGINPNGLP